MVSLPGPALWMVPILLATWGVVQLAQTPEAHSLDVPSQTEITAPIVLATPAPEPSAARAPILGLKRSPPKKILIRSVWIKGDIDQVGLARDGTIDTPSYERAGNAAWYKHSPTPGEAGASVILGHVDSKKDRAVFFELRRVKRGDRIEITRADGSKPVFTVDSIEQFAKNDFPTERVYANTADPTLRLVTCGGRFDPAIKDYLDNIIVFATLATS